METLGTRLGSPEIWLSLMFVACEDVGWRFQDGYRMVTSCFRGLKTGLIRRRIRHTFLVFFWFFFVLQCILLGFRFFIIPKWLIKAPGHIPILSGSFLELGDIFLIFSGVLASPETNIVGFGAW